tara:strand:+ start:2730 stop:3575 length:846 start_codon:yes stop_codon:yes gene_type:complete
MKIGILGQGYVGTAIKIGFEPYYTNLNTFDKFLKEKSSVKNLEELVECSDIIFVCLPTPMKKTGECDISIVEEEIKKINQYSNENKIVIIKSTVPPGTTQKINQNNEKINIIFNPEFLTELNFLEDFKNQNRIILGGNLEGVNVVEKMYQKVFQETPVIKTDSKTAEMVKYITNTFLATKVSFANEMKILCDSIEIDYNEVIEYALYDQRLGSSHWAVPGPDGKFGFGGSCFPKDLQALIKFSELLGINMDVLKSVWETNLKIRSEKDWEKLKGRAVINDG